MTEITAMALKDRICDASDRIPTARWPFFSTTEGTVIPQGGTGTVLAYEAERDTLLTDLTIRVTDAADADLAASVDIEYCNVDYAEATDVAEFKNCCQRKPIFLVGVRENKKLKFTITLAAAAPANGAFVSVTVSGFQGDGCCS